MKAPLLIGAALLAGRALWADPAPALEAKPVYNPAPDQQAASPSPMPTMAPFGHDPAPYPSLDPSHAVSATAQPVPGPAIPPSHEWEDRPLYVLALSSHGSVLGPSVERVLGPWFSAQALLGLHSDSRYNALSEGVSLRLYPSGHAPKGLYLEGQDDFIQEDAATPNQGVYQAQRIGLALGWQWLLRGSISVSLAGALYQEDPLYTSHRGGAIGSDMDATPGQVQAALDLSLGWDL
ncbi:MAG TPA: hypothetical protein VK842_08995 [bacterium]|nr:hypothetical protein [bacterium]